MASVTRIDHPLGGGSRITYEAKCKRYFRNKDVQESGFDPVELW